MHTLRKLIAQQEKRLTNFSDTDISSDGEDPGQTDPVEQSDQDPHEQKVHNKAREQIDFFTDTVFGSDNGDPSQTDSGE